MMPSLRFSVALAVACISPAVAAHATKPKLDDATCAKLRVEQTASLKTGILSDLNKGPEWAKSNLSPDRIRDIKHYIQLDEEVRFGCRDAKLSAAAEKASEAAARIEINSDADPLAPVVKDPAKPGAAEHEPKKKPHHHRHKHKKSKKSAPKPSDLDPSKTKSTSRPPAAARSASADDPPSSGSGGTVAGTDSSPPMFGFGKTMVIPAD
jgi:hypothetical protein